MITAFLGKGGVGKSSIASAFALNLSKRSRTLLVSTDFMSSLPYIFSGSTENLDVVSLSENEVSSRWKTRYGEQVYSIVQEFVDVDRSILDHIATSPGVAEEFMISELVDYSESGAYENIVWDTPASSSTMHLLKVESEFYQHLGRDIKFLLKIKSGFDRDRAANIIREWQALSQRVWDALKRSRLMLVTTPDELSVMQSLDIERDLMSLGLEVDKHICNRMKTDVKVPYRCDLRIGEFSGDEKQIISGIQPLLQHL